ncbi:MAG: RNA polymerase sigma factor [Acidobacteriota bacterium]|nr:RNA polymerase sigma factor [Acidobacteriota bacterium]MDW3229760.1 RNA polymerase sigma factor [Acidobacteriota bacterium]MDY0232003.1 RNA polymerase sigma factor [Candidatus Saccharicenans sp.]
MVYLNNSLVLRMIMFDNISRMTPARTATGGQPLETTEKIPQSTDLSGLIRNSQSGNLEAFEQLYSLYKKKVYGLAFNLTSNHQTAEDLVQDIFVKIFSSLKDMDQPELFPAWVYRISLNTCYSYLRRQKILEKKYEVLTPIDEGQRDQTFDSRQNDLSQAINEAISLLPEKLRTIFILHEVDGLTHDEIATVVGCQVGTSKSQLFKARMKLRKILGKKRLLEGVGQ